MSKPAASKKSSQAVPPPVRQSRWLPWIKTHAALLSLFFVLVGTGRIVSTYTVFNHTSDEPAHIACGMEWLDKHTYKYEPQHPPLARVLTAVGPYLAGRRSQNRDSMYNEGAAILYWDNHYDRNLTLARLGILPFFWVGSWVVYLWAKRHFGALVAVCSVLLFTMLPPVLAHAGLATTDMALTAMLGATFLATIVWAESPGWRETIVLGLCGGLMALSKLSCLAFFPVAAAIALIWFWTSAHPSVKTLTRHAGTLAVALVIASLVIWAGYRFSFGKEPVFGLTVPAPEFVAGIQEVQNHNRVGHPSYLLGQHSSSGFWYYYPVVLAVKTPIAFLALAVFGCVLCIRRRSDIRRCLPLAFVLGILAVALVSRINIGIRHILPVYMALSIVAAVAVVELMSRAKTVRWIGWLTAAAGLWLIGTSVLSHPDYLPYTNLLAGDEPEKVVADSDLDWGQDMKRLGTRLRELGAPSVTFDPFIIAYLEKWHGFPPIQPDSPDAPTPGYHAVSLTVLKVARMGLGENEPELQPWPERIKPIERVGKGILLYYFAPAR